jgi:hypothetical protein
MAAYASVRLVKVTNRSSIGRVVMPVPDAQPVAAVQRFNSPSSAAATTAVAPAGDDVFWEVTVCEAPVSLAFGTDPATGLTALNGVLRPAGVWFFGARAGDKCGLIAAAAS